MNPKKMKLNIQQPNWLAYWLSAEHFLLFKFARFVKHSRQITSCSRWIDIFTQISKKDNFPSHNVCTLQRTARNEHTQNRNQRLENVIAIDAMLWPLNHKNGIRLQHRHISKASKRSGRLHKSILCRIIGTNWIFHRFRTGVSTFGKCFLERGVRQLQLLHFG